MRLNMLGLTVDVPQDVLDEVFSRLSSKERWDARGVSKCFDAAVLATSMKLYPSVYWFEPYEANWCQNGLLEIISDYHLASRTPGIFKSNNKGELSLQPNNNISLYWPCIAGNVDILNDLRARSYTADLQLGFIGACEHNKLNIVKYMRDNYSVNVQHGVYFACKCGHIDIVKYLLPFGPYQFDKMNSFEVDWQYHKKCIRVACKYGHGDIVKYLLAPVSHFADIDVVKLVGSICEYGHIAIMDWMLTTWDIDYVSMSIISGYAGRGGHDEIIQRLLELDADRVWIMEGAARGGQLHIIEYFAGLSPLSQSEIDHLFKAACICGITKIAQYFVENNRDAIDINKGLNYTLDRYHNEDIRRYFRSIGATIPDDLIGDELTNALDEMIFNDEWYS